MMRPYWVKPATSAARKGGPEEAAPALNLQTVPNPFEERLQLRFTLQNPAAIMIRIYDEKGAVVKQLYRGENKEGPQLVTIDGSAWRSGIYFCELLVNGERTVRKIILEK